MGLDIIAHEHATFVRPDLGPDDDGEDGLVFTPGNYPEFAGREDGLAEGWYEVDGETVSWSRSYHGYGWWRENLARMAGYTAEGLWANPDPSVPFFELVHFADNEGTIGPVTSAELAKDFGDYAEQAARFAQTIDHGDAWLASYEELGRAFRVASGAGLVRFR